jgi:hypothetical protein
MLNHKSVTQNKIEILLLQQQITNSFKTII